MADFLRNVAAVPGLLSGGVVVRVVRSFGWAVVSSSIGRRGGGHLPSIVHSTVVSVVVGCGGNTSSISSPIVTGSVELMVSVEHNLHITSPERLSLSVKFMASTHSPVFWKLKSNRLKLVLYNSPSDPGM